MLFISPFGAFCQDGILIEAIAENIVLGISSKSNHINFL